ncbi:MAG: hypothetical protein Q8O76_09010, partial [Chloroflexota bacterium]|nr:hypothetical protein [Chloroflexota bacterium]
MPYTVTRQRQWPDGTPVVEVSAGGLDYTNPDALVAKYPGEFQTYDDPREAVNVAIAICEAWRKDGEPEAQVGYGATGGMTMPFDACPYEEARAWAQERYEALPKCDRCRNMLPSCHYPVPELDDEKFCRE